MRNGKDKDFFFFLLLLFCSILLPSVENSYHIH